MKPDEKEQAGWAERYQELTSTCQLWIAVSEAKDERISELESECDQLRLRVARLSRMVGRRNNETRRSPQAVPLRRTPSTA